MKKSSITWRIIVFLIAFLGLIQTALPEFLEFAKKTIDKTTTSTSIAKHEHTKDKVESLYGTSVGKIDNLEHLCNSFGNEKYAGRNNTAYTFQSDKQAQRIIRNILDAVGMESVARKYGIHAANVPNAAAVMREVGFGSGKFKQYILYNPNFIDNIKRETGTKWGAISILAHEIGHHIHQHTLDLGGGSRPHLELEADNWSGYILAKMGATKEEAQAAMKIFASPQSSSTHPGRADRLTAILAGYKKAKNEIEKASPPSTSPPKRDIAISERDKCKADGCRWNWEYDECNCERRDCREDGGRWRNGDCIFPEDPSRDLFDRQSPGGMGEIVRRCCTLLGPCVLVSPPTLMRGVACYCASPQAYSVGVACD